MTFMLTSSVHRVRVVVQVLVNLPRASVQPVARAPDLSEGEDLSIPRGAPPRLPSLQPFSCTARPACPW